MTGIETRVFSLGSRFDPSVVVYRHPRTHGVALLVHSRTSSATYWCALVMTAMLAVCAFVVSFAALPTPR
jgi:hypothetical protein